MQNASATALEAGQVPATPNYGVLDLETQRSAQEVGGWHRADLMKVSCGVRLRFGRIDTISNIWRIKFPTDRHLKVFDCVIGFNSKRFDYKVLSGYTDLTISSVCPRWIFWRRFTVIWAIGFLWTIWPG
jgi:DEAD/DEAH box helicase domain-containing protein